ncbi:MAG: hypothetical protein US89_C0009G0050 [Candidatus Peregrinibacteria bacterium GW2011_GWF2_38_29]|nr:MAG: hypothetical protein US89_C0009G0050 [Candidatus Peregrinibacteria bacterium GW2011_GWF2_38_29]HBB02768.1 hypothetical protein [Candidatus Peregrinibacteria bacterium]
MDEFEPELDLEIDAPGYKGKNRRRSGKGAREDLAGFVFRLVDNKTALKIDGARTKDVEDGKLTPMRSSPSTSSVDRAAKRDFLQAADSCITSMHGVVDGLLVNEDPLEARILKPQYLKALAFAVKESVVFALDAEESGDAIKAMLLKASDVDLDHSYYADLADNSDFIDAIGSLSVGFREAVKCVEAHYFPSVNYFNSVARHLKLEQRPVKEVEHFVRDMLISIYSFVVFGEDESDVWGNAGSAIGVEGVSMLARSILDDGSFSKSFHIFLPGNSLEDLKAIMVTCSNNDKDGFNIKFELRGDFEPDLRARFERIHGESAQFYDRPDIHAPAS